MVRETRHLWVGNLPDNIREDRIREHFKRYGRVQNVKLLGRTENSTSASCPSGVANSGICATVAFMDIKSASKAHNAEHVLDERTLTTEYYEPTAIPSSAGVPSAGSSPAGSGYSGSSSSVNSAPVPASTTRYHSSTNEESTASTTCAMAATAAAPAAWRGTNDSASEFPRRSNTSSTFGRYQRNNNAPYSTPPSNVERTTPHPRWYASGERVGAATGGESTPSTPGGGTEGGRRRRNSGSGSSRSESSSPEPSDTSRASTPAATPSLHSHLPNNKPTTGLQHQWPATVNGRPLAICVRNLPTRSTDSSIKDGLYHEYKKHGKVVWVKVVGQNAERYAIVRFKKPSDVEKALEVSQDKLFFGCKISVAPHQSCDEDAESAKPYETDIDEYHPKATRTLFIGNLEKDVTQQQLRDKFKHFGRIIEIDIKKGSGGGAGYAFCQYASISSVVEAIRAMDGEHVGGSRVKLGFGKPVATTCVWVDGLTEHTEKQVLGAVSRCGAATSVCVDRAAGAALVHFEQAAAAGAAVRELRRVAAQASAADPDHPRLCVDYASRECQEAFYEQLEKHGGSSTLTGADRMATDIAARYLSSSARPEQLRYEVGGPRSRASSYTRGTVRNPRFPTLEHYDPAEYAADRRYRVYDELGSSPPAEEPHEDRLQSVVVSPHRARRRRDSSPDDRKRSKERHRSAGGITRRSRSGSRGGERHSSRRRHRRRRDGSKSSRAGTPLRDELDAPPVEPRRPPRERPPLPMSLPLPKFAAQLLRSAPPTPRPAPAPAPASPPRPPSSSSSEGSAPHSPSLEERIRSLDEKYEKWSGSRALSDAPDRSRLRHRLLEVDINEVKPSEVVRSLLAKRSVFDEDSERLESATRAPSPHESPRSRPSPSLTRTLRYPFPSHSQHAAAANLPEVEVETSDRLSDPRLNRLERQERLEKLLENEFKFDSKIRLRTPSIEFGDRKSSPKDNMDHFDNDREQKRDFDIRRRNSYCDRKNFVSDVKEKELEKKHPCDKYVPKMDLNEDTINSTISMECSLSDGLSVSSSQEVSHMLLKRIDSNQEPVKPDIQRHSIIRNEYNKRTSKSELASENCSKSDVESDNSNFSQINDPKHDIAFIENCIKSEISEALQNHFNSIAPGHCNKDILCNLKETSKCENNLIELLHKENILDNLNDKKIDKERLELCDKKVLADQKNSDSLLKSDCNKMKYSEDRLNKVKHDYEDKNKINKIDIITYKSEKDKKIKEEDTSNEKTVNKIQSIRIDKDSDKLHKDRDIEKVKSTDDKQSRHESSKTEKFDKDKRRHSIEIDILYNKIRRDERNKQEKLKKDIMESRLETKKEPSAAKSRKNSRDESIKDVGRKDSTDSSTSKTSQDSCKFKDTDNNESSEDLKMKIKVKVEKEHCTKGSDLQVTPGKGKSKHDSKEDKDQALKCDKNFDLLLKPKKETEKLRHNSLDSPNGDTKRKERLNSCSSLPSNIGHKRRISSQDLIDSLTDETKKCKNESKSHERRDSKDSRNAERHKTTKFSKGHFAKIIESKTKEDKKNQVKPPDESFVEWKERESKDIVTEKSKSSKKCQKRDNEFGNIEISSDVQSECLQNDLDFLATLELRSSEEDERQKALRKEMKEKKRIQQLQQIQEFQLQQGSTMHQSDFALKCKDDKRHKLDDKKRENAREKRISTDRKSKDEKDNARRKNRRQAHSSDTSDSDEPKKHSIFDIVDEGPTYISMYDKVKARSCKNMQKQEEEKRQEKIKAKFSQLKQSRAKREEKKRSSWDEDSDSDIERKKSQKASLSSSSDEEQIDQKQIDKSLDFEYNVNKTEYFNMPVGEQDHRNKLSRKNSRTRILSDSSDDEISKRSISKSPSFDDSHKENTNSPSEVSSKEKDDKMKKTSLMNLFGKSDSDETKTKSCGLENKDYFAGYSSENESNTSHKPVEVRKKHKKKQKHKPLFSDDDRKCNNDMDIAKHKQAQRNRRHSNKKEKRKEKLRESVDTDEMREDKRLKKNKKSNEFDYSNDLGSNNLLKKDGKLEDIFGPLSDESDRDNASIQSDKISFSSNNYDRMFSILKNDHMNNESKLKEKDENRRRREKKRKERRSFIKEDDNSLDVDAAGKAIEACLFSDAVTDDCDDRIKAEHMKNSSKDYEHKEDKYIDVTLNNDVISTDVKTSDKFKKDNKDRKKKKKRSKDDRSIRNEHHHFHNDDYKPDRLLGNPIMNLTLNDILLDIPLPNEKEVSNQHADSQSLPKLTDSPPLSIRIDDDDDDDAIKNKCNIFLPPGEEGLENGYINDNMGRTLSDEEKRLLIEAIPMPPPLENIVEDISKVPLPKDSLPDDCKITNCLTSLSDGDFNVSEKAVRSISNFDDTKKMKELENTNDDTMDEKVDEKPRAHISQEETEDAVAALLGESFGGKANTFVECYEVVEPNTTDRLANTTVDNDNIILEEDAEEMRQAVQNLNASEMEIKPDTPVSDNDLLLIDTDTEEGDDLSQDALEGLPPSIIANNQGLTIEKTKSFSISNITIPSKIKSSIIGDSVEITPKLSETEIKVPRIRVTSSTVAPVITSWSVTTNRLNQSSSNLQKSNVSRDGNEYKSTQIATNILQLKSSPMQSVSSNTPVHGSIATSNRVPGQFQVFNNVIRSTTIQPPTIKIPAEPYILYQKPLISPKTNTNDPGILSPKSVTQGEGMTSPRVKNMTILSNTSQNLNTMGLVTPTTVQQRSPGHLTVVRVQQPPLSPIQTMHLPTSTRTMLSPNRPNSVLVQTQGTMHYSRLPVTPVLTPLSKQLNTNNNLNLLQQNKGVVPNSSLIQKKIAVDRKNEFRNADTLNDSKIILTPNNFQQSTNPTVMAQNRLISMQSALQQGNVNSIQLSNKVLINSSTQINDNRENKNQLQISDQNHVPMVSGAMIHVSGLNQPSTSILQSVTKPVICSIQDTSRGQGSNIIHTLNSQRLLTTVPVTNVLHIDSNKSTLLPMTNIRSPSIFTKLDTNNSVGVTTSLTNVVMTPLLVKTAPAPLRLNKGNDTDKVETALYVPNVLPACEVNLNDKTTSNESDNVQDFEESHKGSFKVNSFESPVEAPTKCETDFEELLKDKTNEIKISNDSEKKLEINVGKTIALMSRNLDHVNRNTISIQSTKILESETDSPFSSEMNVHEKKSNDLDLSDSIKKDLDSCNVSQDKNNSEISRDKDSIYVIKTSDVVSSNDIGEESISHSIINSSEKDNPKIDLLDESRHVKIISEGVIKKIDEDLNKAVMENNLNITNTLQTVTNICNDVANESERSIIPIDMKPESMESSNIGDDDFFIDNVTLGKRGGRNVRGKKTPKKHDKVQSRQISKHVRGAGSARRGRGRSKADKISRNTVNHITSTIPGDVYDFHEDSGDETSQKTETRPRLILTIKSPLSGVSNALATSTLSITQKDTPKISGKMNKEEKLDEFASPSTNTRKSKRLQEKDVLRSTVDEVIDDVVKTSTHTKTIKDSHKKRSARQAGSKSSNKDKTSGSDLRKSPRGTKRSRDRSLSDTSMDSCDERPISKEEPKDAKLPKLDAVSATMECSLDSAAKPKLLQGSTAVTPIMKPPKKMISEISAKLAGAFEVASTTPVLSAVLGVPVSWDQQTDKAPAEAEKQSIIVRETRNPEFPTLSTSAVELKTAATGEPQGRRLLESVPGGMMPVGATEATDARVQSPALPHRPSSTHRPVDRITPVLMRAADSESASCMGASGVSAAAGAGASRAYRAAYVATPSLPRGAHHPPQPAAQPPKQIAIVGPHHQQISGTPRVNITSVPAISPQSQVPLGEGLYPHFSHQHYQMYQQHFHATQQENRTAPASPYTRSMEEGCEAPTPPLELRRPPSARVPRPAHSPAPADRLIMYAVGCGRSPPPAHGTSRLAGALPPTPAPGPPHASQVPREADSLQMLLRRYPVMWQGLLALKNDSAAVQMHFVGGNPGVAGNTLPRHTDGSTPPLRIAQRMRLEPTQLDQVHRKMKMENEHCMLLALPCGRDHMDVLQQSNNLTAGFITYLQCKQAAGIVNVAPPGHQQALYTVHIFPSCDFANENLNRIAPDLMHRVADIAHLLIVIATV